MLLISSISTAQIDVPIDRSQLAKWNNYTQQWVYNDIQYVNLTFTLAKTYVTCDDAAHSFYRIDTYDGEFSYKESGSKRKTWKCIDDKGRRCEFTIWTYKDNSIVFSVMYDDTLFRYYPKTNGLSPLNN